MIFSTRFEVSFLFTLPVFSIHLPVHFTNICVRDQKFNFRVLAWITSYRRKHSPVFVRNREYQLFAADQQNFGNDACIMSASTLSLLRNCGSVPLSHFYLLHFLSLAEAIDLLYYPFLSLSSSSSLPLPWSITDLMFVPADSRYSATEI